MTIYYDFDVLSKVPARIFVLFRDGESMPVAGPLNILDVIPGDAGYNDFRIVNKVTVPAAYMANTITILSSEIMTKIYRKPFPHMQPP